MRATAQVDRHHGERLVHRHDEIAGAVDALAIAERLQHRLAEHDADVFDRVVLIDVEIAGGLERQVEAAVTREQLEHVIEEADAGADVVPAAAVDDQLPRICVSVVCRLNAAGESGLFFALFAFFAAFAVVFIAPSPQPIRAPRSPRPCVRGCRR